jgi:hypothetical protein
MPTVLLINGRRVNPARQALTALRNARTRAAAETDPAMKAQTLAAGSATAMSWLDGSHHLIARPERA